jgi:hypothetical protein
MTMAGHRISASILACLVLAGCSGGGYPWYREGMTEDQLRTDEKECAAQARDYMFLHPDLAAPSDSTPGGGPSGRVVRRTEGDLFRTCMNARGYARVPPPKKEAAPKPDTGM